RCSARSSKRSCSRFGWDGSRTRARRRPPWSRWPSATTCAARWRSRALRAASTEQTASPTSTLRSGTCSIWSRCTRTKGRTRSTPWCWARRLPASTHSPDAMGYVQRITVRFNEVDYARIVYYPRLFSYCHWVFEDFFGRELGIPYAEVLTKRRVGFPVVSAKADFRSPLRFGDICRVEMEAAQIGRKSLTTRYRLYQGE